jgi:hypothetical protein
MTGDEGQMTKDHGQMTDKSKGRPSRAAFVIRERDMLYTAS